MIITADWHLTNRPDHAYRWKIFDTVKTYMNKTTMGIKSDTVVIAGDIVDAKDHHCSAFVNRLFREVEGLAKLGNVIILMGNHDYIDRGDPFFRCLDYIENVHYIRYPTHVTIEGTRVTLMPHDRGLETDYNTYGAQAIDQVDNLLICHQTIKGCEGSNGIQLDGMMLDTLDKHGVPIIAGDVHVPQTIGNLTYCGSPHPINLGDEFEPRMLLWSKKKGMKSVKVHNIKRLRCTAKLNKRNQVIIDKLDQLEAGDHAKVVMKCDLADATKWDSIKAKIKQILDEKDVLLFDCVLDVQREKTEPLSPEAPKKTETKKTPSDLLLQYSDEHKIPEELLEIGKEILGL